MLLPSILRRTGGTVMYVGGIDLMRAPITLNEHGHGDRYKDHMESSTERYHVVPSHTVFIKQPHRQDPDLDSEGAKLASFSNLA